MRLGLLLVVLATVVCLTSAHSFLHKKRVAKEKRILDEFVDNVVEKLMEKRMGGRKGTGRGTAGSRKPSLPTVTTNCHTDCLYCFTKDAIETCATVTTDCNGALCLKIPGKPKSVPYSCAFVGNDTECVPLPKPKPYIKGNIRSRRPAVTTDCDSACVSGFCYEKNSTEVCVDLATDCPAAPLDFIGTFVCLNIAGKMSAKGVGYNCTTVATVTECLPLLRQMPKRGKGGNGNKSNRRGPPTVTTDCDATCNYCFEKDSAEICVEETTGCSAPPADLEGTFVCLNITGRRSRSKAIGYECTTETTETECEPLGKPESKRGKGSKGKNKSSKRRGPPKVTTDCDPTCNYCFEKDSVEICVEETTGCSAPPADLVGTFVCLNITGKRMTKAVGYECNTFMDSNDTIPEIECEPLRKLDTKRGAGNNTRKPHPPPVPFVVWSDCDIKCNGYCFEGKDYNEKCATPAATPATDCPSPPPPEELEGTFLCLNIPKNPKSVGYECFTESNEELCFAIGKDWEGPPLVTTDCDSCGEYCLEKDSSSEEECVNTAATPATDCPPPPPPEELAGTFVCLNIPGETKAIGYDCLLESNEEYCFPIPPPEQKRTSRGRGNRPRPPEVYRDDCDDPTCKYCFGEDSASETCASEVDEANCPPAPADLEGVFVCLDLGESRIVPYECDTDPNEPECEAIKPPKERKGMKGMKKLGSKVGKKLPHVYTPCAESTCLYCYNDESSGEECAPETPSDCSPPKSDFMGIFVCLDVGRRKSIPYDCMDPTDCVPLPKKAINKMKDKMGGPLPTVYTPCVTDPTCLYCYNESSSEVCASEIPDDCPIPNANFTGIVVCLNFGGRKSIPYDCINPDACEPLPRKLLQSLRTRENGPPPPPKVYTPCVQSSCDYCFKDEDSNEICLEEGDCPGSTDFTGDFICLDLGEKSVVYDCTDPDDCKPLPPPPKKQKRKHDRPRLPTVHKDCETPCEYCFEDKDSNEVCATETPGECRDPPTDFTGDFVCLNLGKEKSFGYDCSVGSTEIECDPIKPPKKEETREIDRILSSLTFSEKRTLINVLAKLSKRKPELPEVERNCPATCTDDYCYVENSSEEPICASLSTDCPAPPAEFPGDFVCLDVGAGRGVGYDCSVGSTEIECAPLKPKPQR